MKFRIAMDSGGELPADLRGNDAFVTIPLTLDIGGESIVDDGHESQLQIVGKIAADPHCPKTACPSPEAYLNAFSEEAEHNFAITLSSELSGSYQSAMIAKDMFEDEHPDAKIYVFNSRSSSVGESLVLLKIMELEEAGRSFDEIVADVEAYISVRNTLFVLDNLETLRKNGRLSRFKAAAASVLRIKPICYGTPEGVIGQLDQARGINKAIVKMVQYAVERTPDPENRVLGISYVNCRDRAMIVRDELLKRMNVKEVFMTETGGLSTVYANDGGIIVAI